MKYIGLFIITVSQYFQRFKKYALIFNPLNGTFVVFSKVKGRMNEKTEVVVWTIKRPERSSHRGGRSWF